jgi:hypothetical protein
MDLVHEMKPELILAGNSVFTLLNEKTGNRFTYKVNLADNGKVYFVSVLTNPNQFSYMGVIDFETKGFKFTAKSKVKHPAFSARAWLWFFTHRNKLPETVKIFHAGNCARCGRTLTTPESIQKGIGPECSKKI